MALHSSLTDPNLHEPKGVAAASSGTVYVANGSGSGTWTARLPSMSGKSGYFLTNDGTNESWSAGPAIRARATLTSLTGTPAIATGSINVASVSIPSTGSVKIDFTSALASTNFQAFVSVNSSSSVPILFGVTKNVAYVTFSFVNLAGTAATPSSLDFFVLGGF